MTKRMTSLVLSLVLLLSLTACAAPAAATTAGEESTPAAQQAETSAQQAETGAQQAETTAAPAAGTEDTAQEGVRFEDTIEWAAEFDVVVVGFGAAGASTAITAAQEGAKVLLLEKAPEGEAGGNSAICMQWICGTKDAEATKEYIKALRGDFVTPSDEMIDVYVAGLEENFAWFESLGAPNPQYFDYCEFPELPGADSFTPFTVDGNTGMSDTSFGGNGAAYKLLKTNVEKLSEQIEVWYEAPATHLIQDAATGIIHGVQAEADGREINVRAKNGVVLCCGGFENSPEMQQNFTQRLFWPSTGNAHYNTGDGIRMAMEVGADLWHMSNVVTNIEFVDEENGISTFAFQGLSRGILVGPDGTRCANETERRRHGKYNNHGTWENSSLPDYMYLILDQTGLDGGRLHFTWSEDGKEELEKGWIVQADSLAALAEAIGVDAANLENSVGRWNADCAAGVDTQFGRTANLTPIDDGPYYAVKIMPCMGNTQGGPVRNVNGEVLDPNGDPIPHLYESGELGDIWSNCYQASCNFGGGCIFGRIVGKLAAQAKDDVSQESVMGGRENYRPDAGSEEIKLAENEYLGEGQGKGGTPVVVKVTMDGDTIAAVEVVSHSETPVISDPAIEQIPAAIVAAGSTQVDVVTSATLTSNGIIAAVEDALGKTK